MIIYIYIYANYYDIDENGKNDIYSVTPHTKNEVTFPKELDDKIVTRDHVLLFGDIVDDINMVKKEKLKETITVGFLDKKIEQNLELYKSTFDVVLTNNASYKEIENLF